MFKTSVLPKQISLLNNLLKDTDRKPISKLISEMATMVLHQRCLPSHYVSRYLYKKDRENFLDYFPNKFLYNIKSKFNDPEVAEVLENKLYFNFFYGQFTLPLPKILMYNHKKMFIKNNQNIEIDTVDEFKLLLLHLLTEQESGCMLFIKRTYGSYGGASTFRISSKHVNEDPQMVAALYQEVIHAGYLFQETIRQHPEMDTLNPSCINTIRLDTFIDNTGKIEIISGHMRMSIKNSHVDNIGSGGCAVAVDLATGRLKKFGYMPFKRSGGKRLTEHPLTNTVFENFAIPHFEEAKELVLKAASLMPGLRLIGWDIGIGTTGPVLIEGNSDYDITGSDLMECGYGANTVFRKALKEINFIF